MTWFPIELQNMQEFNRTVNSQFSFKTVRVRTRSGSDGIKKTLIGKRTLNRIVLGDPAANAFGSDASSVAGGDLDQSMNRIETQSEGT